MTMLYLLQVNITLSSRIEPPGCAIKLTPLLFARSILSPNGKNASEPSATPVKVLSHALFPSPVRGSGFLQKVLPYAISKHIHIIIRKIYINSVISIWTTYILFKF